MTSFRKTAVVHFASLTACVLGAAALPTSALADGTSYAIPDHVTLDKLGVNIAPMEYQRQDTFLTIDDPADGGLAWTYTGHSNTDSYQGGITYAIPPASSVRETLVKIAGHVTVFVTCQDGTCVNESGTAATLLKSGANWLYTDGDGSVYKFDSSGNFSDADPQISPVVALGTLLTITRPSGAVISLVSGGVVSSRGYALKYGTTGISLINLANHTCDAALTTCDGIDATISFNTLNVTSAGTGQAFRVNQITDAAGQNWQYGVYPIPAWKSPDDPVENWFGLRDGIRYFKGPDGHEVTLNYDSYGRLLTFTDNRGVWHYSYPDESGLAAKLGSDAHTISVTDPSGSLYYTAFSSWNSANEWPSYVQDPFGNKTSFGFDGGYYYDPTTNGTIEFSRLAEVLQPEGNHRTWTHDARGNVTAVTDTPKTGSGLSAISMSAVYPSTCTNPKTCNKPTSQTDANGHTTDFTYDPTHGGLLIAMGPAPSGGAARPLKLMTWVQKTPYYKNPSGVLTASATPIWVKSTETQCQTVAGSNSPVCDSAAPQVVTTYEYGADGTANALWPHGVAVSSSGTTLRTCYSYDALGNKISETKPNANLATCP